MSEQPAPTSFLDRVKQEKVHFEEQIQKELGTPPAEPVPLPDPVRLPVNGDANGSGTSSGGGPAAASAATPKVTKLKVCYWVGGC